MTSRQGTALRPFLVLGIAVLAAPASAQVLAHAPGLNLYGSTGLIDMPSAMQQPDGTFSASVSTFAGISRVALSFQISPRLSGTFRYTAIANWNAGGFTTYYDRSFDLRYQLLTEGRYRPAVTVGLQDFAGTGLQSGEYVVASKSVGHGLTLTGGVGWGRFAPNGTRPIVQGTGGKPNAKDWFHGPMAAFGGVEWQATDRLAFKLEYSPDSYALEAGTHGLFKRRSPWNVGMEYRLSDTYRLGAYYLYGSELGVSLQVALNPQDRPTGGILDPAPLPLKVRPPRRGDPAAWSTAWVQQPGVQTMLRDKVAALLAQEGMTLEAFRATADSVQLRLRNERFDSEPEAIGRAARILTRTLPASVETFRIVPVVHGIPASMITLDRSDLEALEFAPDGAAKLRAKTRITAAGPLPEGAVMGKGLYRRFRWSLGPYARLSLFDPDNPARGDFGIRLRAAYDIAPGLVLSGSATKKVVGNLDKSTRVSTSTLPHVRSDAYLYDKYGDPALERLTLAWYAHPAKNIYTRVTAGYLERMFGGISAEALWKPVNSRLALGIEANYVKQRDFNDGFGFQKYKVATGHVSAYYEFGHGYFGELDVGRYLAGDVGATVTFDRIFANGWRLGAFATFTNVSAAQFGEGSFDKGIRLEIPIAWAIGQPTRAGSLTVIHPLSRDGGAKLDVEGRLYESLRDYHANALDREWGRVWR